MFLVFGNDEERRDYGGSAFIELQYCRLNKGTKTNALFELKNLPIWKYDNALFVHDDDLEQFAEEYRDLLGTARYSNQSTGLYDWCGVNYFAPENIDKIINAVSAAKPTEYDILLKWLEGAKSYNGFYLLGL